MKATNFPMEDERGLATVLIQLFHAAVAPSAREAWEGPVIRKPGWFERFDQWAAKARQRDRERFLAESADIFELERRIEALDRRPYF